MKFISQLLLMTILMALAGFVTAQETSKRDTAEVNRILQQSKSLIKSDTAKAIALANEAKKMAAKINFVQGEAYALKNLGLVYYTQGKYVETLDYWNRSLAMFEEVKDDVGISNLLNNIAAIYFDQGVDDKA